MRPVVRNARPLLGAVICLATVAAVVFVGVAANEINYANDHPYQYGPAHVIALGAGAGAALSVAVALLVAVLLRDRPPSNT